MDSTMQDHPLTIVHLFERAERLHRAKGIATATPSGVERITYGEWAARTRTLGGVLDALGISADGRVATFAWNTARHLELYFAAPCTGRVLHTLNIRLFPEQITYIVNHAEDEVIFVDRSLLGLLAPLLATFTTVRHVVIMDDGKGEVPADLAGLERHDYEELLAAASPVEFHVDDERRAASMCYTSGTPGTPRASSTATAPRSCTPWARCSPTPSGSPNATRSCPSCPCSMPMRGVSPMPEWPAAPTW